MELAKLRIEPLRRTPSGALVPTSLLAFDVPFNPTSYSIVKPVTWRPPIDDNPGRSPGTRAAGTYRELDAPPLGFDGGGGRTLTLELFFDSTEAGVGGRPLDVRVQTNQFVALTRIERDQGSPPICRISWGSAVPPGSDFPFVGVVTNLTQNFLMFQTSGQPVRAKLTVVLNEYIDPRQNKKENDPDLRTHLVKRGDTLSSIAALYYSDPGQWRVIAAGNAIDDPRRLWSKIGESLVIPQPS